MKGGVRAYARHRGVDPMSVEKAIKSGRITRDLALSTMRRCGARLFETPRTAPSISSADVEFRVAAYASRTSGGITRRGKT